jgi:multiple sugar transport system permease protein
MKPNDAILRGVRRDGLPAMVLLAPFVVAFLLFFLVPAGVTFWMSLTESSLTRTNAFVGLANYHTLLNDPSFWDSVLNTFYFALLTVVPLTALGLVMALLVNRFVKAQAWLQGVFFLPFVLPISVMTLIADWMLQPSSGVINHILGGQRPWLADPHWALPAVAIGTVWWTVGGDVAQACATSRPTCTRRRRWTGRAASRCSGPSPGRRCARWRPPPSSCRSSLRSRCSARPTS